ncbi:MAG: DUF1569 domain-containing protein [Bryobacterales bacterium]|nr:DUF1569 domain-containing protein [Bryobacterales bacterium]
MKSLFQESAAAEITARVAALRAESVRQWGRMSPGQAAAHCAAAMEMATGDKKLPRVWFGYLFGGIAKGMVLGNDRPMKKNAPTARELRFDDSRNVEAEKKRLTELVARFAKGGAAGCTTHPHPFFGALTPEEWAELTYKHLDHHLRQFGV